MFILRHHKRKISKNYVTSSCHGGTFSKGCTKQNQFNLKTISPTMHFFAVAATLFSAVALAQNSPATGLSAACMTGLQDVVKALSTCNITVVSGSTTPQLSQAQVDCICSSSSKALFAKLTTDCAVPGASANTPSSADAYKSFTSQCAAAGAKSAAQGVAPVAAAAAAAVALLF
ncbi:hypothetical protein BDR26DRAFT_877152 [Obelidium mucronatum]|nr:hypothetical protein BDR26DRAFT_877152 [Obelidium mucronatum]